MYKIFLLCLLFFACAPGKPKLRSDSCNTPTKAIFQAAPPDTLFCDNQYSDAYDVEATSLFRASYTGDIDWTKKEIKRGANINIHIAPSGNTPLIAAIVKFQKNTIQLLLDAGADPNMPRNDDGETRASDGSTPLGMAVTIPMFHGNYEIVKLLLEHGANPNIPHSDNGETRLSDGATPLGVLVRLWPENVSEIVKLLLEYGADPNITRSGNGKTPTSIGDSPLFRAVSIGSYKVTKLLLEHGADPNIPLSDNGLTRDSDGTTPLYNAVERGTSGNGFANSKREGYEVAKLLLEHGANPDKGRSTNGKLLSADGATPLGYAAQGGSVEMVQLLLEHGADPSKGSSDNFERVQAHHGTPLGAAIGGYASYPKIVRLLLDAGADPDKATSFRGQTIRTPLMLALKAKDFDIEIVKMLLEAGADLDIESKYGSTAYYYAKRFGTPQAVALLEEYRAKRNKKSTNS